MRKSLAVAALLFAVVAVMPAHATDCSAVSYYGFHYEDISAETLTEQKSTWDCWTLYNLSATTLNTFSTPGFEIRGLSGYATRTYTVGSGMGGHFEVEMLAELDDPNNSWYNQINATVTVYHPGSGNTNYQLYYLNGTQGDDSGSFPYIDIYNVAEGDTITITIQGAWSFDSNSHSRFSAVHLFHIDS